MFSRPPRAGAVPTGSAPWKVIYRARTSVPHLRQHRSSRIEMPSSWRCCRGSAGKQATTCGMYRRKERADAVQEVVASAFVSYVRLIERGKAELAFAGPLARYAACEFLSGRRLGNPMNCHDISSAYCQRRSGIKVEQLDRFDDPTSEWEQLVVEDKHSTPADSRDDTSRFLRLARVTARTNPACGRNPRHRWSDKSRCPDVWLFGVENQPATPRALSWLACLHRRSSADDIISSGMIFDASPK